MRWASAGGTIALPLLLSPLVSLGATFALSRAGRVVTATPGGEADCLCAGLEPAASVQGTSGPMAAQERVPAGTRLHVTAAPARECRRDGTIALFLTIDHLHWVTSGAASFARGLNDAPKIVALVLAAAALSMGGAMPLSLAFAAVTIGMVAGSLAGGRRVTGLLSQRTTAMNHREGSLANLVTSILVAGGALGGLPMSTTHVSSAAILGAGAERDARSIQWTTVRDMSLAWLVTLPAAALLGALGAWVLS